MFQGWVERWPQAWSMEGLYSQTSPDVVDSFAPLSQTILKPPFFMDILGSQPRFFYPLNDPTNATQSVDATGINRYAQVQNSWFGFTPGSVGYGASISSTAPSLTGGINGYAGPVTAFTNTNTSASAAYNTQNSAQWISLDSAGIQGPIPGGYTISGTNYSGWTRMFAVRVPAAPALSETIWSWSPSTFANVAWGTSNTGFVVSGADSGTAGALLFVYGTAATALSLGPIADGNWHLVFVSYETTTNTFMWHIDNGGWGNLTPTDTVTWSPVAADTIGATVFRGTQFVARPATNIQVATVAEWPIATYQNTPTQNFIGGLYTSWRSAYNGESSGNRYQRILGWAGFRGQTNVDVGQTLMGPATDILPTTGLGGNLVTNGTDALTALNNVVITENGNHFVDRTGVLTFQARNTRYTPFTPQVTFGETIAGGEIPYEDLVLDFDTTQVGNDIQITQNFSQQLFLAEGVAGRPVNPGSQAQYGQRTLQRTLNNTNPQECVDAANYYLYRYGVSDLRISKIVVHVSALVAAVPSVWQACLGLELGSMVTVNRRPPGWAAGGANVTQNCFVEHIDWSMHPASATLTMELSPADRLQFWTHAQLHGTVKTASVAGATTLVINPLPDSATNPAKFSFPTGITLCVDPGLPTQDVVSLTSVGATVAGYTSATLTVSAMTFAHSANAVWEDVTSGVSGLTTTPAAFDALAVTGSTTRWAY